VPADVAKKWVHEHMQTHHADGHQKQEKEKKS
jgi:hypothetical protein